MSERKRVLVIDDEQTARDLLRSILEGQGHIVGVAEDGESGLEEIATNPPDLVLLDLTMQGLSGWGVINRLRSLASPPPVIAMSGLGDEEPPELAAIGHLVHGYLAKPFRADQVTTAARGFSPSPTPLLQRHFSSSSGGRRSEGTSCCPRPCPRGAARPSRLGSS